MSTAPRTRLAAALSCLLGLAACAPQIAMQTVPVSTDPGGASVLVDGKPACTAPCQVSLARNQDHILTLSKDGYRQQDVLIKRQYQTNKVLLNALNEGVRSGRFYKDPYMGSYGGVHSINSQEETGEAYVLSPSTVSLRLMPVGGFPSRATAAQVEQSQASGLSPLDIMGVGDQQMLENALESTRSGQTSSWSNVDTGAAFSVVPEPAHQDDSGNVVRWFTLGARQGANTASGHFPAHRVGRGEWAVALPNALGNAQGGVPDKGAEDITRRETVRALGETSWPSVGKTWDVGSSGSSHTTSSTTATPGGTSTSTTTTSTKTSVKAGVNAGPGAIINVLDALMGGGK
jgi:hypothetical protein